MSANPFEAFESGDLSLFHADFRRALMMHRKARLSLFLQLQFPSAATTLFDAPASVDDLDFTQWLEEPPAESVANNEIYRELLVKQARLIRLAHDAAEQIRKTDLHHELFASLLLAMHEFDRSAARLDVGIVTSLTDIDALTGLYNRTAMERDIDRSQSKILRPGWCCAVAMIDIDHFKRINDDHGHAFGDYVLETLSERFMDCLRARDRIYRYGGEEFLVLLPNTPLATAMPVLDRLRRSACERHICEDAIERSVSVSIGVTEMGAEEDPSVAIKRADEALYRAKESGRNRLERA